MCATQTGSTQWAWWTLVLLWAGVASAGAQPASPAADADLSLAVQRAFSQYDEEDFAACIETLSGIRGEPSAIFLRALAHGELALRSEIDQPDVARTHYTAMSADLSELLAGTLTDRYAIANLVDAVAKIKLANLAKGPTAPRTREERERIDEPRRQFLEQAQQALERYLHPPAGSGMSAPTGLNRVRAQFFLGVLLYRQALRPGLAKAPATQPAESQTAPDELVDADKLRRAAEVMESLVSDGPDSIRALAPAGEQDRWNSFTDFYLGLIHTRQGSWESEQRRYVAARSHYETAKEHFEKAKASDPDRDRPTESVIRQIYDIQVPAIDQAVENLRPIQPGQDLFLQWDTSYGYDTNVILLGRNTTVPVDIGGKRDHRFYTREQIGYTIDMGLLSPGLDGLSVGLLGRASDNWNADIHDYNEQDYGASAAIQYELLKPWGEGASQGPLYASIQYDYDYFLLGNDGFVKTNRVTPRLTLYTFDQRLATHVWFSYEDRNYLEQLRDLRFDRDGNYFDVALSQSVNLLDLSAVYENARWSPWGLPGDPEKDDAEYTRWLRPHVGVQYSWDSTVGSEYDCGRWGMAAGIDVPLPYGVNFALNVLWEWEDYYHKGSLVDFHRRPREDFVQTYRFDLSRRFVLVPGEPSNRRTLKIDRVTMDLGCGIQFTDDDSNVTDRLGENIFEYDRAVYMVSASFFFN